MFDFQGEVGLPGTPGGKGEKGDRGRRGKKVISVGHLCLSLYIIKLCRPMEGHVWYDQSFTRGESYVEVITFNTSGQLRKNSATGSLILVRVLDGLDLKGKESATSKYS